MSRSGNYKLIAGRIWLITSNYKDVIAATTGDRVLITHEVLHPRRCYTFLLNRYVRIDEN